MINLIHLRNWLSPLVGLLIAVFASGPQGDGTKLRVAIAEGVRAVRISGYDLDITANGRKWSSKGPVEIKASGKALKVANKTVRGPVRIKTSSGLLYVDRRQYRGEIIVHGGKSGLLVVDELPLETYLVGLINAEVNSRWPVEAIKAQAVAARSYALVRAKQRASKVFDVRATVADQVYLGSSLEDPAADRAVRSTHGEVLEHGGSIAKTFYHSTCGGRTAGVKEVWGENLSYLPGVECDWCSESPRYFWRYQTDGVKIGSALERGGIKTGKVKRITIAGKTPSGRVGIVRIKGQRGSKHIKATALRKALGYTNIFSTRFEVFEPEDGKFLFLGRGSGHGVGMCQWGARGLAVKGRTYREILRYYYRGCSIMKVY